MGQVTCALIGAGLRGGEVYARYALEHPDEMKIVAVAEPDEKRRESFAAGHGIPRERRFASYQELLAAERLADCAMVCTQDRMHAEPVTMALEKGYHVLCEKPMSPVKEEIIAMGGMARRYHRILSVCHVLRYSLFFSRLKQLLDEGKIGRLMTIQHMEEVGYWHHAHSFVRGNWRNAASSSPMILQKCCHDMDILLYLTGSRCARISSFGERTYFREENAPKGAPAYCMAGCAHRDSCPFYAPRFYLEHPRAAADGLLRAVTERTDRESILEALRQGPYGRCVFHCDNTVVDHQTVDIEFDDQVTASFLMTAFTDRCKRTIRLMGTRGEISGDMEEGVIELTDFVSGTKEQIRLNTPAEGHSGSDMRMMHDFVRMVAEGKSGKTGADTAVESHLMALAAEESRVSAQTVDFHRFWAETENA